MMYKVKATATTVAFGDVVRKVTDKADPKTSGLKRYVAGQHMTTDDLKIRSWGAINDDYLGPAFHMRFKPGQVLYGSRRTYLRKVAVADFEGITANTTYVLESKDPNVLLPELLPFIMQTERFHAHSISQSKGSVNPYINFSDIAWYEFALPPLAEQRRIVKRLTQLQQVLEKHTMAAEKADLLWQAISVEHFENQDKKVMEPLENHYQIVIGQVDPRKDEYSQLPLIAPNHIEGNTGNLLMLESAEDQGAISGKYLFDKGAVIYSKIRPNLVKVVIAPCKGLSSADMYPLIPKETIRKEYLLEILLSRRFTQFAIAGSKRTGMPKLNRNYLSKFTCKVPNLEYQDAFLQKVLAIRQAKTNLSIRMSDARKLKQAMLYRIWE
jgi:type I restriction enzyme S subunit